MNKYLFVSYREWALKAYHEISFDIPFVKSTDELITFLNGNNDVKFIFFVGWSEIIKEDILNKYSCFCIHPSMLPLYRGGSPIQNQILDGILDSGVTLFKMNNKIDAGPIFSQKYLSLRGSLSDIFNRISYNTADLIRSFICDFESSGVLELTEQDESKATLFKRRKPSQSEITLEELKNSTAIEIYNKIRSLDDPYPNAYIQCKDGKKLLLKKVSIE
jgi:methionyl-tRNA formyltransferase